MAKKCKHCGTVVEDGISICPKCDNFAFTDLPKLELSGEQIQELEKGIAERLSKSSRLAWRLTWRVVLVIFAVLGIPGAIVGWSIWSSMQTFENVTEKNIQTEFAEFSERSSNQIEEAHSAISNDVVAKFGLFQKEASNRLSSAYASVTNQITAEFQTPRIKQTVEDVARGEASSILDREVRPAVDRFQAEASFIRTVARAEAYDFKAFQQLIEIGNETNDNAVVANLVLREIDRSLEKSRNETFGKRELGLVSGTNIYRGPFTSDELATGFSDARKDTTSLNREAFVNAIAGLNQPLFLPLLIEFFTNETDLGVADWLTMAISSLTKQDFHPRDFYRIEAWWHSHENDYTNWPISDFENGLARFSVGDYSQAFQQFQSVLKLDPSADQSRALAVVCSLGMGNTNKVAELTKDFKQPDARWAKWAKAIVELNSGSISNATVQLADLTKTQPTMGPFLPTEGASFWNRID